MSRAFAMALSFALMSSAAVGADLSHQLIAPNLNPGLKTVPWVSTASQYSRAGIQCIAQLADRIDSGTIAIGPNGMSAHITGMASLGGEAELVLTSLSPDGRVAEADFVACNPYIYLDTPSFVAASLDLVAGAPIKSVRVRAQQNSMVLHAPGY